MYLTKLNQRVHHHTCTYMKPFCGPHATQSSQGTSNRDANEAASTPMAATKSGYTAGELLALCTCCVACRSSAVETLHRDLAFESQRAPPSAGTKQNPPTGAIPAPKNKDEATIAAVLFREVVIATEGSACAGRWEQFNCWGRGLVSS